MEELYLVTGSSGFLGHFIVEKLKSQGKEVVVGLRLPGDKAHLSEGVDYEMGDITKTYTLQKFFERAKERKTILIHCAGFLSRNGSGICQMPVCFWTDGRISPSATVPHIYPECPECLKIHPC